MVLQQIPKAQEKHWRIVLHYAATGRSCTLGDMNYNLQAAAGARVVYLKRPPDGKVSAYAADIRWPSE